MSEYIGISENKLHHILSVARECYRIAKEEGFNEDFCRKMFMIGWNHDVGYEFSKKSKGHSKISSELIYQMICFKEIYDTPISSKTNHAIYYHGQLPDESLLFNDEWRILNIADLTIDSKGNKVSIDNRLNDIQSRYGKDSEQYNMILDIANKIGLI